MSKCLENCLRKFQLFWLYLLIEDGWWIEDSTSFGITTLFFVYIIRKRRKKKFPPSDSFKIYRKNFSNTNTVEFVWFHFKK